MAHWTVNLPSGWRELVLLAGTTRVNIAAWTPPAGERPRITGVLEDDADVRYLSRFILDGRQKRVVIHVTAARSGGVGGGRHDLSTTFEEARRVQVAAGGAVWGMPSPNVLDDNAEPYIFHQPAGDPGLERAFDGIVQAAGKLSAGQNVVLTLWDGAGEDPFNTPRPPAAVFDAAASGGVTLDFAGTAAGAVRIPDQTIQLPAAWMRGIRTDFGGGDFVDSLQWYPPIGQRPRIAAGFAESGAVYLSDFKIVNDRFGSDEISLFLNFSTTNVDGADQRADLAAAWESAGAATVDAGNHGSATLRPADAPDTADPYNLPANADLEAVYRSIAAAFGDGVRIPSASRTAIGLTLSMTPPATTFEAAASGSVSLDFAGAASAAHLPFAETHSASASGSVSLRFSGSAAAAKHVSIHKDAAAAGSLSLDFSGAASAAHLPFAETHSASASGSVSLRFSGSAAAAKHVSIHKDAAAAGSLSLDFSGAASAAHLPFAETHSASASGSVSLRFSGAASAAHLPFAETHSASASGSVSLRFSGSAAAAKHVSIHKDAAAAGSLSLDFSGAAAAGVHKNIVAEAGSYYGDEATGGIWVRHGGTWHLLTELEPSGAATWFFRANAPQASLGADGDNAYKWTSGEWYVKAAGAWSVKEDLTGLAGLGGVDGRGVEYIFASSGDGAAITGAANLPLASQNYDVDALRSAGGLVRGTRKYYDGTPPDLDADRPYMIRFRRAVPGQPAQNDDIGDAPWTQEPAVRAYGREGEDGEEGRGVEYIFASSGDGAAITGAANLPLASQNYDVDALRSAGGLVRGTRKYYDGTPPDLDADRPYMIRFRRAVPGQPAQNDDIGDAPWTQEPAVRAYGREGEDGEEGRGVEYIFASSGDGAAITGAANLPLASQNYDVDALRSAGGLVRGTRKYYDGTPPDLDADRPYMIRFRRAVPGQPAQNDDIGDAPWTQEPAVRAYGREGEDGEEGRGVEYIFASSGDGAAITGAANLPLASQNYDVDALRSAGGLVRGTRKYYDGTPPDLDADRPYMIRFRRAVPGQPAQNDDIGDAPWTQEPAVRAYGREGEDGEEGRGVEYIFASSGDGAAITGAANLPLASQNYDVDALRSAGGLVRGTRKYYDGTPPDLDADRPYMIRFRRAVPGQPAQNDDIGDAPWTQEPSILVYGQDGPLIEFIYLLKDDPNPPARVATSDAQDRMDGYVPAGATDDPDPTTPALRFRFESRRKRGSSADPWGKFSPWKRVSSHANAGPAVYSGHGPPAVGIGLDGDTYVELTGSTGRLSVWLKIAGAWEKASGNPDNAAWSTGSGKPAAAAANGSYYGDSDSGNVWIRHGGAWRWAVDLDPSGDVKWRFGSGVPGNSLGAGGDRYYRWSSGVWYEKAAGRYVARGDLTVGYDPARRNTKPAPAGVRAQVEGTSVTISWRPNPAESYDNQGAPRPLLVFCGGIKIDDDAVAWPGREHIVSPDTTSATIGDLKPNTKYTARICARYDNGGQNINLAAISAYEEVDFTTGTRTVEADAASGNAGTFRNTSGTDTQVNLATNGNIMELRSGSSAARVGRFETDGSFVTSGEVTADDLGVSSDRRLKTDIARIDSALEKLARLRGCTFEKRGRRSAGLIAQDVAEALPEAVTEKDGYLQLSSAAVNGLLVEAVNELAGAVDELRGRLDDGAA